MMNGEQVVNTIYDVVGIGFGPANLSLAIALEEENPDSKKLFLESKEGFVWHPGMLIDDTNIQISFLKDLVTLRNPRSHYSFLNYLYEKDRLKDFVNLTDFYPSRFEYNDYMTWVSNYFEADVQYSSEVLSIDPVEVNGEVEYLSINVLDTKTMAINCIKTKNVVLGTGSKPKYPVDFDNVSNPQVFHTSDFMHRIKNFSTKEKHKFSVVGSGQSSAEILRYLINHYPESEVTVIMRSFSYKAVNESKLLNKIFDADQIDLYYHMPLEERSTILQGHRDTNYNVADSAIITYLNKELYKRKMKGQEQFRILSYTSLEGLSSDATGTTLKIKNTVTQAETTIKTDAVILATGYTLNNGHEHMLLDNLKNYILEDLPVNRDYTVSTTKDFHPKILLQGCNENTHGLGDTLLSNLSIRASEIAKTINSTKVSELEVLSV